MKYFAIGLLIIAICAFGYLFISSSFGFLDTTNENDNQVTHPGNLIESWTNSHTSSNHQTKVKSSN